MMKEKWRKFFSPESLTPKTDAGGTGLDFKSPWLWLATWFGCGFMRPASGTWGTLGAVPIGLLAFALGGKEVLAILLFITFVLGLRAAAAFEAMSGDHDNSSIVIDEAAGIFVTFLLCPALSSVFIIAAFLLFRLFDIIKPWPVSFFDRMAGAKGVMLDDIIAGIYAGLVLQGGAFIYASGSFSG